MEPLRIIEAENERYAATLVFLHGLWAGPDIWRPLALGFAHRGWRCALVDVRGAAGGRPGALAWSEEAEKRIDELATPVVVVGHDAGALLALSWAERGRVTACVAVAPLLEGARPLVGPLGRLRARLGGGAVPPPGPDHAYRRVLAAAAEGILKEALVPESPQRISWLRGRVLAPGAPSVPALLVAQAQDAVVSPSLVEITARGIEADSLVLPGSHWPMLEPNPDAWLSPVHRWLIRRLGPSLLLLRGDEDLVED
jgi:pimeloyl-ACP methyl ester carboxylesterase